MVKQHTRETYELLFDSAAGDIEAYKELFERYSEKLYNFVYYLTYSREESEDITSEAFIKVFEALQGRDVTSFNFQAYLYKTARNLSLKAIALCANISETPAPISLESKRAVRRITDGGDTRDKARESILGGGSPEGERNRGSLAVR